MLRSTLRIIWIATVFSSLATTAVGCLSESQQAASLEQARHDQERVVCRREYPTGSHIPQTICYRQVQVEDRRTNDQEKVRTMQIGGALVIPGAADSQ